MSRSWVKRCKTTVMLVSAGFLICEAGVRLYERIRYRAPLGSYDRERTLWTYDHAFKIGRPGAKFKDITMNSLGLRGPDLRSGTTRIVCIGASETFGIFESPGNEFPRQLERLLNRGYASPQYDVLNWSYAGALMNGFSARVPEFAARVHPAMALIYSSPAAYIGLPSRSEHARKPTGLALPQLRSAPYATAVFRAIAPVTIKSLAYRGWIWLHQRGRSPLTAIPTRWLLQFRSDLEQLVIRLRQEGIEPVLLTHATPIDSQVDGYNEALLIHWRRFYPEVSESALLEMEAKSNEWIRRFAQQEGVQLVDVEKGLRDCRECFVDFVHFTDYGAAKVAVFLGTSIKSRLSHSDERGLHPRDIVRP